MAELVAKGALARVLCSVPSRVRQILCVEKKRAELTRRPLKKLLRFKTVSLIQWFVHPREERAVLYSPFFCSAPCRLITPKGMPTSSQPYLRGATDTRPCAHTDYCILVSRVLVCVTGKCTSNYEKVVFWHPQLPLQLPRQAIRQLLQRTSLVELWDA